MSTDAGNPPSDSVASLSLSTLLDAVSKWVHVEMARATINVESVIEVELEGQVGLHAQCQALAIGESTYSTEVVLF